MYTQTAPTILSSYSIRFTISVISCNNMYPYLHTISCCQVSVYQGFATTNRQIVHSTRYLISKADKITNNQALWRKDIKTHINGAAKLAYLLAKNLEIVLVLYLNEIKKKLFKLLSPCISLSYTTFTVFF